MAISVNIDAVITEDAAPETAPHKISKKSGKELLTFKFTPTATGPIRAWRARRDPTNRNTGTLLGKRGMYCGGGDVCGPNSYSVSIASGTQITETTDHTELGDPADGEYEVKVYALSDEDGWSS